MRKTIGFLLFYILFCIFPMHLSAAKILYYVDTAAIGEDSVIKALQELSSAHEYVVSSTKNEFENELAQNSYDLVILSLQDKKRTTSDFPAFVDHVNNNGKVIFSDANMDESFASFLGFAYTGSVNQPFVDITDVDLKKGIEENPFLLYNPGYITWSMGLVPTERTMALFSNGEAAIIMTSENITISGYLVDTLSQPSSSAGRFTRASIASASMLVKNTILYTLDPPQQSAPPAVALPISLHAKMIMVLLFALSGMMAIGRKRRNQLQGRQL